MRALVARLLRSIRTRWHGWRLDGDLRYHADLCREHQRLVGQQHERGLGDHETMRLAEIRVELDEIEERLFQRGRVI